jgi:hypothetical protein
MESAMKKNALNTKPVNCKAVEAAMPDLLFEPGHMPPAIAAHLETCTPCTAELTSLHGTMHLLDSWEAPEPSPYWMARMGALLREEQAQPRRGWAGFKERFSTRMWTSRYTLKPAAGIAALGLLVAAGGGTWLDLSNTHPLPTASQASNTVRDLQSLNENAQVFQQLSTLDGPDTGAQGND